MDFYLYLILLAGVLVPVMLLYCGNLSVKKRYRQRFYPLFALLIVLISVYGDVNYLATWHLYIGKILEKLEILIGRPLPFLQAVNDSYPEWVINFSLITSAAILKLSLRSCSTVFTFLSSLTRFLPGVRIHKPKLRLRSLPPAYACDISGDAVFRPGWLFLRRYVHILLWGLGGSVVVVLAILVYADAFYRQYAYGSHLLPLVLAFFLEVFWYLGQEVHNNHGSIEGDSVTAAGHGEFISLWEAYGKICPERLLVSKSAFQVSVQDSAIPSNGQNDDSFELQMVGLVQKNLAESKRVSLIPREERAILEAFKGTDLLLIEPVFNRVNTIAFALMQYHYMLGHHILVVLPPALTESGRDEITGWLSREFGKLCFAEITLEAGEIQRAGFQGFRLQVASMDEVLSQARSEHSDQWFKKLTLVVAPNGPSTFHSNSFQAGTFCNFLADFCDVTPQYLFLSAADRAGEESAMRDFLNIEPLELSFGGLNDAIVSCHVWKAEGPSFQEFLLWTDGGRFLGNEPLLTVPALQAGRVDIKMFGDSSGVWREQIEELEKSSPHLNICNRVPVRCFPTLAESGEREVVIVGDVEHNVIDTVQSGFAQAEKEVLLLVVSESYLLRNYLCANIDFFMNDLALSAFLLSPRPIKSVAGIASALVARLQSGWVTEDVVSEYLDNIDKERSFSIKSRMVRLFETIFDVDVIAKGFLKTDEQYEFDEEKKCFKKVLLFHVTARLAENSPFPSTTDCITVFDASHAVARIPADQFFQNYLPGQIHGFKGEPYKIGRIDPAKQEAHVHHTFGSLPGCYRSILHVVIDQARKCAGSTSTTSRLASCQVETPLYEGRVIVSTKGYHVFTSGWHFEQTVPLRENEVPPRDYAFGRFLRLTIRSKAHEDTEHHDCSTLSQTLAFLLGEIMPTLFPRTWKSLLICTPSEELDSSLQDGNKENNPAEKPFDFIPKLTTREQTDAAAVTLYFIEDSSWDLGMIRAVQEHWKILFSLVEDYLIWHLESEEGDDFLKLGGNSVPGEFELKGLLHLLGSLLEGDQNRLSKARDRYGNRDIVDHETVRVCDFCGGQFSTAEDFEILEDKRERCTTCQKSAVDTVSALSRIYTEAHKALEDAFSIKIPSDIKVKFQSAEDIAKVQNKKFKPTPDFDPRAVGLSVRDENEIWIENGHPAHMVFSTCVHELTHCWQFKHLNMNTEEDRLLMEGHATWCEIFCLQLRGIGQDYIEYTKNRQDIYGQGFQEIERRLEQSGFTDPFRYLLSIKGK